MKLYKIRDIVEADYGCEECPKDGPRALLICDSYEYGSGLEDVANDAQANCSEKRIEVSEKWIAENGIREGKLVDIKEDGNVLKAIRVVAAVIQAGYVDETTGQKDTKIFATQRGYGEMKGGWEFPGGKIEENETPEEALIREIREELDTEIKVEEYLNTVEYDYPKFHLSMDCFVCTIVTGDLVLKEHEAAKWLSVEQLDSVDWLPADVEVVEWVKKFGVDNFSRKNKTPEQQQVAFTVGRSVLK